MKDRVEIETDEYYRNLAQLEMQRVSKEEYDAMIDMVYSDTDVICEAIGSDGIQYPDTADFHGMAGHNNRMELDEAHFLKVGRMLRDKDYYGLGQTIAKHAEVYIQNVAMSALEDS